ncbi:MAG: preprotein translocase subunit SecG [Flavobacteriales bacterium]|jgi:preprotein translocase subunit SecG
MATFIVILIVIIAILLGLIILVQNPKGGGLAVGFSGTSQIGGVQRTTDFLEKATWYLGIAMMALCLLSAAWYTQGNEEGGDDRQIEQTAPAEGEAGAEGGALPE